jgi:hypothetical protein
MFLDNQTSFNLDNLFSWKVVFRHMAIASVRCYADSVLSTCLAQAQQQCVRNHGGMYALSTADEVVDVGCSKAGGLAE